jgi:integral membrane protein (TIGR01906 family)
VTAPSRALSPHSSRVEPCDTAAPGNRPAHWPSSRPYVAWLATILFVISVPLFLITINVLQVTNDLVFYEREFALYRVDQITGLTSPQLREVALAFLAYFGGQRDALDMQVEIRGVRRPLFNQRELAHMEDVFHLMQGVKAVQVASGLALIGLGALGFILRGRAFLRFFGRLCLMGGGVTIALLLGLAGLALVDFGDAFVQFHLIAFSNDLWILDPTRDYLLMLFPEGFWFDATMRIAILTAIEAAALAAAGAILMRWAPAR